MKNLKKLQGAKVLSKQEQRLIKGGRLYCSIDDPCPGAYRCIDHECVLPRLDF